MNPTKCEWSWLDRNCTKPCPICVAGGIEKQISFVPTDEIQMLGVPLGSDEKVAQFVEKELLGNQAKMVNRLADFDDIQSAFFLLRVSFSIVRATHFMRTTPLTKWKNQAESFDKGIWDAAQGILGLTMSEQSWKQACLTPCLGGLGPTSWRESKDTSRENWSPRNDVSGVFCQKRGSFKKDEEILKMLIDQASNQTPTATPTSM